MTNIEFHVDRLNHYEVMLKQKGISGKEFYYTLINSSKKAIAQELDTDCETFFSLVDDIWKTRKIIKNTLCIRISKKKLITFYPANEVKGKYSIIPQII